MEPLTIILLLVGIFWLTVVTVYIIRLSSHYGKLTKGSNNENLKEILDKIIAELEVNKSNFEEIIKKIDTLTNNALFHLQKVGVMRFNPFSDTGGDQSFILALLNGQDSGIVLTSLHSRGITSWYAKNVHQGKGIDLELSKEEKEAIKKAK